MATKSKKRGKRPSSNDLLGQVRRALEKRQFKQAVKDARVCYRREPSNDHRLILQQALAARAHELCRGETVPQARALLQELLSLQPIAQDIQAKLPELLLRAGLMDRQKALKTEELSEGERERLRVKAADLAVIRPKDAPLSMPEIIQGGIQVRAALEALEHSEDARAAELIRGIGRQSPFADWRFFVRGLAAFYRGDSEETRANWDRLDAERMAHRIARHLRTLTEPDDRGASRDPATFPSGLVAGTKTLRALSGIRQLQHRAVEQEWEKLVSGLRALGPVIREFDEVLYRRTAHVVIGAVIKSGQIALVSRLAGFLEAPRFDPCWNRTRALTVECDEEAEGLEEERQRWRTYLDDLDRLDAVSDAERRLIKALVWHRIASIATCDASTAFDEFDRFGELELPWAQQELQELRDEAVAAFHQAQQLCPTLRAAHEDLARAYHRWGEDSLVAATYRKLLEQVPDDVDSLLWLGEHESAQGNDPIAAAVYFERAHVARPLDAEVARRFAHAQHEVARCRGERGEWELGRAALQRALSLLAANDLFERAQVLAHCATLELLAGDYSEAQAREEQLRGLFPQAAPATLLLASAAGQYGFHELAASREEELKAALRCRANGATAGLLAEAMHHLVRRRTPYQRRQQHLELVCAYLERTSRVRYEAADLRRVLEFLGARELLSAWGTRKLTDNLQWKLAKKARKKFPDEPYFHCRYGQIELQRGPDRCRFKHARCAFQQALELLQTQHRNSEDAAQLKQAAKEGLERLRHYQFPRSRFGGFVPSRQNAAPEFARRFADILKRMYEFHQRSIAAGACRVDEAPKLPEALQRELAELLEEAQRCGIDLEEAIERLRKKGAF